MRYSEYRKAKEILRKRVGKNVEKNRVVSCKKNKRKTVRPLLNQDEMQIKSALIKCQLIARRRDILLSDIAINLQGAIGSHMKNIEMRKGKGRHKDIADILVQREEKENEVERLAVLLDEIATFLYSFLFDGLTPGQYEYLIDKYLFDNTKRKGNDKKAIQALTAAMKKRNTPFPI